MKTITLKLKIEPEKLSATRQFMDEKGLNFDEELSEEIARLYKKHVPAAVRKYIERSASTAPQEQDRRADSEPVQSDFTAHSEP
ncbi:hypothetical protein [Caproicibacter fermentans]|uniref:Uncharacterized protein n=1 Tax=Caproicibacter fermentans TaxID=2576756 RepID=A0A7G8TD74_9FIRM|nr:hypothetical protein [Caproicibacter fermentans]QNK41565.1 hypothetical protein HCR03_04690 [Caproicibacter fermentans]